MFKAKYYSLWAINDALNQVGLCRQLDEIRRLGFDGVVFHPRFYPNQPPYLGDDYLSIVSDTILHAKSIGLEFWIYDENGWPSGTVGGELLLRYPELTQQWMEAVPGSKQKKGQWEMVLRRGTGVDYLNPALAEHFLEMTYERYRTGLRAEAFEYVTTFFCDEPEFGLGHAYDHISEYGAIPWTPGLSDAYREKYGENLNAVLPLIVFGGEGRRETRIRFWELLTDLFCQSFISPMNEWCRRHGKRFTAHIKGEEHPLFQAPMVGSCHQVFQHLALPGIDALERYPSGHFFPRQVVSAAQQFGDGQCMVECFGGAGWGAGPEDLERYLQWLGGHGLTHFVLHLNQLRLSSHAIRDWPPSIPCHVTWREAFPQLLRNARKAASGHRGQADTLLVAPYRAIMAEYEPRELRQTNVHNASTYPDTPAGRINREFLQMVDRLHESGSAYHVCDERSIEQHGHAESGKLLIGKCAYDKLIIPDAAIFNEEASRLIAQCNVIREAIIVQTPEIIEEESTAVLKIKWEIQRNALNSLVLEAESIRPSRFIARFTSADPAEIRTEFADHVSGVMLNGKPMDPDQPRRCIQGVNDIQFECDCDVTPFVAVRGNFAVRSGTPYVSGPGQTIASNGPFTVEALGTVDPVDLIASGYPFCSVPLLLHGTLELPFRATAIHFIDIRADCARLFVDNVEAGWCWGPHWTIQLPAALAAGSHNIRVHLIPSTFNHYGPHHHVGGDRPIVSPDQYRYVRNFADDPNAPDNTRVGAWHFKRFGIGNSIGARFHA